MGNFGTADAPGRRLRVWVLKLLFVSFHCDEAPLFCPLFKAVPRDTIMTRLFCGFLFRLVLIDLFSIFVMDDVRKYCFANLSNNSQFIPFSFYALIRPCRDNYL